MDSVVRSMHRYDKHIDASPVKEETLTPPRKAEPVRKSRQESRPVVRPRPTEVPILVALSATNGVVAF